jgi:hypothetical protein
MHRIFFHDMIWPLIMRLTCGWPMPHACATIRLDRKCAVSAGSSSLARADAIVCWSRRCIVPPCATRRNPQRVIVKMTLMGQHFTIYKEEEKSAAPSPEDLDTPPTKVQLYLGL